MEKRQVNRLGRFGESEQNSNTNSHSTRSRAQQPPQTTGSLLCVLEAPKALYVVAHQNCSMRCAK